MKTKTTLATLREASDTDLHARIKTLNEELFQHKLKRFTNQLTNTTVIGNAKREIAQAQTLLRQRAIEATTGVKSPLPKTAAAKAEASLEKPAKKKAAPKKAASKKEEK
jgi:ribosomal protein L29